MKYLNFGTLINWFLIDFWKIVIAFILSSLIAIGVALSLPNEYTASTKLISNMDEGKALSGALAGLDGLASIAGVSIGGDEMSPEVLAEIMLSSSFLGRFAVENEMLPIIFAAEGFNTSTGEFVFDESIYNPHKNSWTRDVKYPATPEPGIVEATEKLRENLGASYDRKTKLVTVSYTSYSPEYSYNIVTKLISSFNQHVKQREIQRLNKTVAYLKEQLEKDAAIEVRSAIQKVLEEQFKKLALAQTRNDFAFEVIEEPQKPYKKSAPKRAIITLLISLFGTIIFILGYWSYRAFWWKDD